MDEMNPSFHDDDKFITDKPCSTCGEERGTSEECGECINSRKATAAYERARQYRLRHPRDLTFEQRLTKRILDAESK